MSVRNAQKPRGKTRRGRLSRLDALIVRRERVLLASASDDAFARACVVDVGVGEEPHTTLELAAALAKHGVSRKLIAVEIDRERCERARATVRELGLCERVEVRQGGAGFELPLRDGERALWVRAMNLLRSYSEDLVRAAHRTLASSLLPGGLLVEGSGSPDGGVLCAHLLRREHRDLEDEEPRREALLFMTDFSQGFAPQVFRDRLPRDLRKHAKHGGVLHAFFEAWQAAFIESRVRATRTPRALFEDSVRSLAERVPGIELDQTPGAEGVMLWRPTAGVPRGAR